MCFGPTDCGPRLFSDVRLQMRGFLRNAKIMPKISVPYQKGKYRKYRMENDHPGGSMRSLARNTVTCGIRVMTVKNLL